MSSASSRISFRNVNGQHRVVSLCPRPSCLLGQLVVCARRQRLRRAQRHGGTTPTAPVTGQGQDDHRAGREALAPQGPRSPQGRRACPTRSWEASATSHLRRAFQGRRPSGSRLRQQGRKHGYVLDYVRSTARADTMARRTRHNGLLAFPAEVPLTPGTLDQEVALPQRDETLAKLTILCLESEKLEC